MLAGLIVHQYLAKHPLMPVRQLATTLPAYGLVPQFRRASAPGRRGSVLVAVGSGLIGLGVGASVSPALFISGFSLHSAQIQRAFTFELARGVAAFLVAPVLLYFRPRSAAARRPAPRPRSGSAWPLRSREWWAP